MTFIISPQKPDRLPDRREFIGSVAAAATAASPLSAQIVRAATDGRNFQALSSQERPDSNARRGTLNYHPEGLYIWDTWYFTRGEELHVIHLQKKRPGSTRSEEYDGALGHAVSTDLLTWKEMPPALYRGPTGSVDDMPLFTGWTIFHEGKYYLFYTARSTVEKGLRQRICLATSEDAINWKKRGEPVIVPDSRWYDATDCRDLVVHKHPQTGEFHGFYAAARRREELVERPAIAHVRSRDLIHWMHEPPVFEPSGYGVVECPDVFYLEGRWWMICATGNFDGVRAAYSDPYIAMGTIYASSDRLEGPYKEGDDNVLMGSMEFNGFTCRSFVWKGRRYILHSQAERRDRQDRGEATLGSLSTPKEAAVSKDGQLRLMYSPLIEKRINANLISHDSLPPLNVTNALRFGTHGQWQTEQNGVVGAISKRSWSVRLCGPDADSFMCSAEVCLRSGRAIGLLFRGHLAVVMDYRQQNITFTNLPWMFRLDARQVRLEHGRTYHLRVISKGDFFEVYLDDVLVLNFVRYQPANGRLGFYIEAGEGSFSKISATSLIV